MVAFGSYYKILGNALEDYCGEEDVTAEPNIGIVPS